MDMFNVQYGPCDKLIKGFLNDIILFPWCINVGKPHPKDSQVIRVFSVEEAWELLPSGNNNHKNAIEKMRSLFDLYKEKRILTIEQWLNGMSDTFDFALAFDIDIDDEVKGKIAIWAGWTVLELLVSFDETAPYFFRRMIPWYRDGHWPVCIRDSDNKIVVY